MKTDYLKENTKRFSVVLLAVSLLLGAGIAARAAYLLVDSARAEKLVKGALAAGEPDPNDVQKYLAGPKEIAEELKKKNLFAPPPPKPKQPIKEVDIIGDSVVINGKFYKVGDKVKDATILEIAPTYVRFEWQGKEITLSPFDVKLVLEEKKQEEKKEDRKPRRKERRPERKRREEKVSAAEPEEDPLAWMGVKLSDALRAKLLEKWNSMSDEDKEKWKEQWNKMSDEQKEQMVKSMEEHVDQM
ncbi:MAG: hypothetical protein ACYTBJ_06350 [Planctomycetota bacterium]|jgi:hypothetical protein